MSNASIGGGGGGAGTIIGPASSTDNAVVRWDGITGTIIQDSSTTLSDANLLSTGELNLTTDLAVQYGGTGASSLTDGGIVLGSGSSAVTVTAQPSNGQLLIGSTGADPVLANLTAGTGISITNGAGSITITSSDSPDAVFGGEASSHDVNLTTAIAPLEYVDLGTVEGLVRAFDATTEEYMQSSFRIPGEIDSSGTVTFEVQGWSKTAAANKNVAFTFGHRAIEASEAIDGAYTDVDADDQSVDATQDDLDIITWTETVSNLGWVAGDMILYRFSRFAATTNNLASDYYVKNFFIRIPRT